MNCAHANGLDVALCLEERYAHVLPKGSKRCFPNGVLQFHDLGLPREQLLLEEEEND